jgi:beta-lactamase class A
VGDHKCRLQMIKFSMLTRLVATAMFILALHASAQNDPALTAQLQSMTAGFHGKVSLYAHDLATGQTISIDADQPVPTASVIKLGILYTALEQIRAGRAHFDDRLTLRKEDQVPGSGVLLFFDTPLTLTLKDALTLMIAQSDNTASNLVIDHLGLKTIDDQLTAPEPQGLALKNTWLYKKVYQPAEGPQPADQPQFGLGKTTAHEMAIIMERFVTCNLGPAPETSPAATPTASTASTAIPTNQDLCTAAVHMLKAQFYRNSIPRYLEKLDTTEGDSAIANKSGALDHVRNDVGAVYTKHGTIIISAFTHDNADTTWTPDNEAEVLMAKLAQAIVTAWAPAN